MLNIFSEEKNCWSFLRQQVSSWNIHCLSTEHELDSKWEIIIEGQLVRRLTITINTEGTWVVFIKWFYKWKWEGQTQGATFSLVLLSFMWVQRELCWCGLACITPPSLSSNWERQSGITPEVRLSTEPVPQSKPPPVLACERTLTLTLLEFPGVFLCIIFSSSNALDYTVLLPGNITLSQYLMVLELILQNWNNHRVKKKKK